MLVPAERLAEMRKPEVRAAILTDRDIAPDEPGVMANVYGLLAMAAPAMFPIDLPINYEPEPDGNFSVMEEMIRHPHTTIGLSDAGAHVSLIFDAVNPTYQITHWVRDGHGPDGSSAASGVAPDAPDAVAFAQ